MSSDASSPSRRPDTNHLEELVEQMARSYPDQAEALELEALGDRERGSALASVARLDMELQAALRKGMIGDTKVVDQIFSENGPLFQLGPKIRIAYAFGIISRVVYEDLIIVSRIRNDFAHKAEADSFKWDRVRSNVGNLKIHEYLKVRYGLDYLRLILDSTKKAYPDFDDKPTTENCFQACIQLLSLEIERSSASLGMRGGAAHSDENSHNSIVLRLRVGPVLQQGLYASINHLYRDGYHLTAAVSGAGSGG